MVEPRRRFRFLKELSEGAFGKVYMAEMITGDGFSSIVALKLLHGKWVGHQEIAQRSRDEARLLGLLHHRNIVRVEDLTSINGQCAIIMEYLDGVDLKTLASYCKEMGVRVPRRAAFEIGSQIAGAMEAAYNQIPLKGGVPLHVVHRDIKPSNVMVTSAGDVKVLDFGTARANFEEREAKTQALAFGSQAYMAPERLLGDPDGPAGDVFSLGVTLYELMTFQPFGKIYIREERYARAIEERLEGIELSDLNATSAELVRDALRRMLLYESAARPSAGEVVDIMDNLAEVVNDGGLQRFCRSVIKACHDAQTPMENPDDPLAGSTMFEDTSSSASRLSEAAGVAEDSQVDGAVHEEDAPQGDPPQADVAQMQAAQAHSEEEAVIEPPGLPADMGPPPVEPPRSPPPRSPPARSMPPPEAFAPEAPPPVAVAISPPLAPPPTRARPPVAPPPATPAEKPSGGRGVMIGLVVGIVLLVVLAVVAVGVLGGKDKPVETPVATEGESAKGAPGGRVEVGPADAAHGSVKLTLQTPSEVSLASITGYKFDWDGTGTLELVGLQPGTYRTKVAAPGGDAVRSSLEVTAGKSCTFAFDVAKGDKWEPKGCE